MESLKTVQEIAKYLGLKTTTIYNWAQEGRLPAIKIGRTWRFNMVLVNAWLERHSQEGEEAEE